MKKKIAKLSIPVPPYIRLLPGGGTYFNSHNSDRIPVAGLYKYLTGKDPEPEKPKRAKKESTKDETIRAKRWDLNRD